MFFFLFRTTIEGRSLFNVVHQLFERYLFNFYFLFFRCCSFDSPYRSTCNIPTSLNLRSYSNGNSLKAPDSPRSTKSAPWSRSQQKGLFGVTSSPRSVRSASSRKSANVPTHHRLRSSSVESHSSNDSRSLKK